MTQRIYMYLPLCKLQFYSSITPPYSTQESSIPVLSARNANSLPLRNMGRYRYLPTMDSTLGKKSTSITLAHGMFGITPDLSPKKALLKRSKP
jgi:hypothetical protein